MNPEHQVILETLLELEQAVQSLPTASPKPNLRPLLARLDQLTARLPADTAPQLLHYLHKKSYGKARLWLENRPGEIERGGCRGD